MQTVTVQLTDRIAPFLPGKPIDLSAFQHWIAGAEDAPAVSLKAATSTWAAKRRQLQKLTK
jgi:hypothetical protein